MANKLKEQLDYGNYPERMDPNLERKLGSPESLYAQNPAFKKKEQDVQRIAMSRFKKVVDKLRQARGLERMTPNMIQRIYMEEMSKVPMITRIEGQHREPLEALAVKAALDETEVPEGWYQIEALLNREPIDVSNFRYEPEEDDEEEEEDDEEKQKIGFPSFDLEDLTPQEELELEKHKRNLINAIVQGAAKKGHYLFQKPEIKQELDSIDARLYPAYLGIMAINDFLYFSMEQMIEQMSATGNGVAGKVELQDADDEGDDDEGGDGGEEKPDTKIVAEGLIFPILTHELIKGVKAANARFGLPEDPSMREKVKSQVDILSNEPMQLRLGPEIVEKIRFALPDAMFDSGNKGLINWFEIQLYKVPAKEFLELIGNAISEDNDRIQKATRKFEDIMKEAMELKSDYESSGGSEDDEDDMDDFLSSLGISRPK